MKRTVVTSEFSSLILLAGWHLVARDPGRLASHSSLARLATLPEQVIGEPPDW